MTADTIFINGHICTMDENDSWCTAIAVKDGKISALSDDSIADKLSDENTDIYDLTERYVLPGFIGVNTHPYIDEAGGDVIDTLLELEEETEIADALADIMPLYIDYLQTHGFSAVYRNDLPDPLLQQFNNSPDDTKKAVPHFQVPRDGDPEDLFADGYRPPELINSYTRVAASALGISGDRGSIQIGKRADMVAFEENPFDFKQKKNALLPYASVLIIAGDIVYDEQQAVEMEWYELLTHQYF
ncbi:MAG: amidohydrolase family protein [Anaerovoracaceae bacterium]|jgi:predicted amidohydrolase YtcJ